MCFMTFLMNYKKKLVFHKFYISWFHSNVSEDNIQDYGKLIYFQVNTWIFNELWFNAFISLNTKIITKNKFFFSVI